MIARYNLFRPGSFHTKERLLQEMEYYGISEALVFHAVSMENSPQLGNQLVIGETANAPSLHPVWSILPPVSGEMYSPEDMVLEMQRSNVHVIRLFPNHYHFDLRDWCLDEVFDVLSEHRIPVMIDYIDPLMRGDDRTDWESVIKVCKGYPELPVIVTEFRFRTNRRLYQAMDKCPNLHVELSALWLFRAIESICRKFGAERIVFGTRLPIRDPSCALGMVNYAMISEEEKQMVAGDNLRDLMEGVIHG
jgi:predicted TIM-barrel fold metal-dependent hydrolase